MKSGLTNFSKYSREGKHSHHAAHFALRKVSLVPISRKQQITNRNRASNVPMGLVPIQDLS